MAAYTTIDDPSLYFQIELWTGTGSENARTLDGDTNMQPDLVWTKSRSDTHTHMLWDAVRGATKRVEASNTDAESTAAQGVKSFDSDGFTLGTDNGVNESSETYVAWCWKAGTTSGITTTGANITPSAYSMNATSGISIIKYEGNGTDGTNTAHALGAVPHMMIIKRLENANYWAVYHHKSHADPEDYYLILNASDARGDAGIWKDTPPTSVYFRHDNSTSVNANGEDMIAYLFTSIQGYSKFGSYVGNANADGPFIYTGFRPAYFVWKRSNSAAGWYGADTKRSPYNVSTIVTSLNDSGSDSDHGSISVDFLSNGIKLRASLAGTNGDGDTFIYAAFAEAPFVNSNGVPCNAR